MLKFNLDNLTDGAPLYCRYDGQINPQPAYVYLDADGTVTAEYSNGGWSPAEAERRLLSWSVSPRSGGQPLSAALQSDPIKGLLERVHAGHMIEGLRGHLSDDAQDASDQLRDALYYLDIDAPIWDVEDWLDAGGQNTIADVWPTTKTLDEADAENRHAAAADEIILNGSCRDALLSWAKRALRDDVPGLGQVHFDALLKAGVATQEQIDLYDPS